MSSSLKNIQLPKSRAYRTGSEYEPYGFFLEGLVNSTQFNFLLGYFSSSAINILALGFAKFISNGGNVRLIINQFLSTPDKDAILEGQRLQQEDLINKQIDLKNLASDLSDRGQHFFKCLAYLIAKNRIEIVCITPKEGIGISHFKSGIFSDGINLLYFKGSCNFTASGLISNLEELEVKESWDTDRDRIAIKEYCDYFDNLFFRKADFVDYLPIKDTTETIKECFGENDLDKLLKDEQNLIEKYLTDGSYNRRTRNILHVLKEEIVNYQNAPKFPFSEGPRQYQKEAYESWVANDFKGIFAMATGTGKTITALNCLLNEYYKTGFYQAIILVPTNDLQLQWVKEIGKFNIKNPILVSIDANWKQQLSKLTTLFEFGGNKSFIVISTYVSFARLPLQNFLKYIPKETLFIADEAHNIASPKVLEVLSDTLFNKRIGLSATPKRIYDDEGTEAMEEFFMNKPPYTYTFTMEEAIAKGILCQYEYFPHIVQLTEEEFDNYKDITLKLLKFFDSETKKFKNADAATQLLMKRKRIIHKAVNKLTTFKKIIKDEFKKRGELKYSFVYVPEGIDQNSLDEENIIQQYNQAIMQTNDSIRVASFTGETDDRSFILDSFEKGSIDVLTAMKCLDEGVDIPRAELAIFCSSTGNPRQFIQRRGRILRQHIDKKFAVIHDLVVIPKLDFNKDKSPTFNMERSQVENELRRVADFSFMARNQYDALNMVKDVCNYYDINLFEIKA